MDKSAIMLDDVQVDLRGNGLYEKNQTYDSKAIYSNHTPILNECKDASIFK